MSRAKRSNKRRIKNLSGRFLPTIIVAVLIACLGVYLLITGHAATLATSSEAESGTLAGGASLITDSSASGGKAVKFGGSTTASKPHVMVFIMENNGYNDIIGKSSAPYMNSLAKSYQTATNSYALGHYSLDNYLGMVSGNFYNWSTGDCEPGSGCQVNDPTISSQLDTAGIPWKAYMETMPSNCYKSNAGGSGGYGVRHDPFVYFTGLVSNDCGKIVPSTNMISDLNSASPPDFVWYTPNICHDAGDDASCSSIAAGDSYMSSEIPAIQATSWYKSGGIIIFTFDEGNGGAEGEDLTSSGNHILTVVLSTATAGKANYTSYENHFGILGSIEKAYGLACLGQACNSGSGTLPL